MIDLKFGLFWSGSKLSYLRYLTFKTLRHYHPDSEIQLYIATKSAKDGYSWRDENQDFEAEIRGEDYIDRLKDLGVRIFEGDFHSDLTPNYQSDYFRWWWLSNNSGFYLDTDQIVLKSFESLPREYELIYSGYPAKSCGYYTPVGVIGAHESKMVDYILKLLPQFVNKTDYNSMGPFMFRTVLQMDPWKNLYNAPSEFFYPISDSYLVNNIFDGRLKINESNYCLHWYGGHKDSQVFNRNYS